MKMPNDRTATGREDVSEFMGKSDDDFGEAFRVFFMLTKSAEDYEKPAWSRVLHWHIGRGPQNGTTLLSRLVPCIGRFAELQSLIFDG